MSDARFLRPRSAGTRFLRRLAAAKCQHAPRSAGTRFLRRLAASYGGEVPARASYGGEVPARASYGGEVPARAWDCPILAYGPGDAELDHTPQEHLDLDEYQRAIGVLREALPRVMAD